MSKESSTRVDKELIYQKIEEIQQYVSHLEKMQSLSKKAFLEDPVNIFATERLLQIAIECLLDIGNHLISRLKLGKPQVYRDIAIKLYENDIISEELKDILVQMIAFRNRLVHHYYKIDSDILYQILQEHLKSFYSFIRLLSKKVDSFNDNNDKSTK